MRLPEIMFFIVQSGYRVLFTQAEIHKKNLKPEKKGGCGNSRRIPS
jgi:hypothetical protein